MSVTLCLRLTSATLYQAPHLTVSKFNKCRVRLLEEIQSRSEFSLIFQMMKKFFSSFELL